MKIKAAMIMVAAALLLGGCAAEPGQSNGQDDGQNAPATPPSTEAPADEGVTVERACGSSMTERLSSLFGAQLDPSTPQTVNHEHNDLAWVSHGCEWENEAADLEFGLGISTADDFPDGVVGCFEPGGIGEVTPVEGIGAKAWWKFDDFNEAEGTLLVCTAEALVEFEVDAAAGSYSSDELRDASVEAVTPILGG